VCDSVAVAMAQVLRKNKSLLHLCLSSGSTLGNGINEGGVEIARALEENTTLLHLSLSKNKLGEECGEAFARVLEKNSTLTSLDLLFNRIGYKGGESIGNVLPRNSTLRHLGLEIVWSQFILEEAWRKRERRVIVDGLKQCSLTSLDLTFGVLENELLAEILEEKTQLCHLRLDQVRISSVGTRALGKFVGRNSNLVHLAIAYDALKGEMVEEILNHVKRRTSLTRLEIGSVLTSFNGLIKLEVETFFLVLFLFLMEDRRQKHWKEAYPCLFVFVVVVVLKFLSLGGFVGSKD